MNREARQVYFGYSEDVDLRNSMSYTLLTCLTKRIPSDSLPWDDENYVDSIIHRSMECVSDPEESKDAPPIFAASPARSRQIRPSVVSNSAPFEADESPIRNVRQSSALVRPLERVQDLIATQTDVPDRVIWTVVNKLRWVDRDEAIHTRTQITTHLTEGEMLILLRGGRRLARVLQEPLDRIPAYSALLEPSKKDFQFHIIGKGYDFYQYVLQEPSIAEYLCGNRWQPLHSLLMQVLA